MFIKEKIINRNKPYFLTKKICNYLYSFTLNSDNKITFSSNFSSNNQNINLRDVYILLKTVLSKSTNIYKFDNVNGCTIEVKSENYIDILELINYINDILEYNEYYILNVYNRKTIK